MDHHGSDISTRGTGRVLPTPSSPPTHTHTPTRLVLTTANVGDSRIVLGRGDRAVDLTVDHKPSQVHEKARIRRLGGAVRWHGLVSRGRPVVGSGVYRVNGNLSLSRAIGDAAERPYVSGTFALRLLGDATISPSPVPSKLPPPVYSCLFTFAARR